MGPEWVAVERKGISEGDSGKEGRTRLDTEVLTRRGRVTIMDR